MYIQSKSKKRITNKLKSGKGMTVAEMMVTVAIIIILSGVAFISISRFQVQMGLKERDTTAKQLFIAAQNHLTMAKGEGYLKAVLKDDNTIDEKKYGTSLDDGGSYVFVQSPGKSNFTSDNSSVMDLMLPPGSIDETVRSGASYIIRYQPETAKVLDVFCCSAGNGRFDYTLSSYDDVRSINYRDKEVRKDFKNGKILGWYGGAGLNRIPIRLEAPSIVVDNGETLKVTVTDNNEGLGSFCALHIVGKSSGAEYSELLGFVHERCVPLSATEYEFTIDDIKSEYHFCNLPSVKKDSNGKVIPFIAGEDLIIYASAETLSMSATLADSETEITNSLYQSIAENEKSIETDPDTYTAFISKCRHLENLEEEVSNTGASYTAGSTYSKKIVLSAAVQTADLEWDNTWNVTSKDGGVVPEGRTGYYPVSYNNGLIYDGMRHSVTGITTSGYFSAGMFGALAPNSCIKDLKLIDFNITATQQENSPAGTLAARTNSGVKIENVVAYDSEPDGHRVSGFAAGGLVGNMDMGSMRYCGAAVRVTGTRYAGGLIGTSGNGAIVRGCYSGGHTNNGKYEHSDNDDFDVILSESNGQGGGGLTGRVGKNVQFIGCYTTCSVTGPATKMIGGFAGSSNKDGGNTGKVRNCYAMGLVGGSFADNAFIGDRGNLTIENCQYYAMINENNSGGEIQYRKPSTSDSDPIGSIDDSEEAYDEMIGAESTWNHAVPYDNFLKSHYWKNFGSAGDPDYDTGYLYRTVMQLRDVQANTKALTAYDMENGYKLFVNTHYGDWPAPEMFLVNNP